MKKITAKIKGKEPVSAPIVVEPIDYEKLGETIVKAHEKQSQKYSVSREWMKVIICPVLWGVGILAGILAIAFFIYCCKTFYEATGTGSLAQFDLSKAVIAIIEFSMCLFLVAICMFTIATAKEIDKEKDRQYIAAMFSNIAALVALVVSLVALVKG